MGAPQWDPAAGSGSGIRQPIPAGHAPGLSDPPAATISEDAAKYSVQTGWYGASPPRIMWLVARSQPRQTTAKRPIGKGRDDATLRA